MEEFYDLAGKALLGVGEEATMEAMQSLVMEANEMIGALPRTLTFTEAFLKFENIARAEGYPIRRRAAAALAGTLLHMDLAESMVEEVEN